MNRPHVPAPIVVTAALPGEIFAFADGLRRDHFPPERNVLPAHLTLFHAIAPSCEGELRGLLADLAGEYGPLHARLAAVIGLGRGTALAVEAPMLLEVRARIAERFAGTLTAQDDHRPRLHVTVQNKVAPDKARQLQGELRETFVSRDFAIPAIEAHYYRGGPWEAAGRWPFRGANRRGKQRY